MSGLGIERLSALAKALERGNYDAAPAPKLVSGSEHLVPDEPCDHGGGPAENCKCLPPAPDWYLWSYDHRRFLVVKSYEYSGLIILLESPQASFWEFVPLVDDFCDPIVFKTEQEAYTRAANNGWVQW